MPTPQQEHERDIFQSVPEGPGCGRRVKGKQVRILYDPVTVSGERKLIRVTGRKAGKAAWTR